MYCIVKLLGSLLLLLCYIAYNTYHIADIT